MGETRFAYNKSWCNGNPPTGAGCFRCGWWTPLNLCASFLHSLSSTIL